MTHRIDYKRAVLAALTAVTVALALVLVAGGSPASADAPNTLDWTEETNQPSFWEDYGDDTHGEDDWVCVKDDTGSEENAYVIGDPPGGSVWRLLVVKAGSEINDLNWDPVSGQSFEHSRQRGWSHVILCSRPAPTTGKIIIEKQTVPDGDQATFGFAGDVAGTLSDGQRAEAVVAPGQYTSTETVPAGWALTSIVCDDGNSSGNTGTKIATFNVEADETVTCVFTNTKDLEPEFGRIIIEKQTVPDGDQATFGFAGDVAGTLSDGQTVAADVAPGQYTSTETVPAGWVLTSIVCDDGNSSGNTGTKIATFNVEADETVTCVFTNTKDEGPTPTPPADTTTTTIEDIVFPTSIVSTTVVVSPTDETLPFTGFENGATGLLALILVASGALALVGARVFREETDE